MNYKRKTINELGKYYKLKTKTIPNLKNRIELLQYELEGVNAVSYDGMPKASGGKKTSYRKEKLIQEKTGLEEKLKLNLAFVNYIESALNNLNNIDKNILIESYAKDKYEKLSDIELCEKLSISSSNLYRRKKEIIEEFKSELFGV